MNTHLHRAVTGHAAMNLQQVATKLKDKFERFLIMKLISIE